MAVALSGSIVLAGSITGSLLGTSSYSSNTEFFDGLDSSVFALTSSLGSFTSSLNDFSSSINTYTASNNANIAALNAATASLYNATASLYLTTASLNQYTASLNTRSASFACVTATNNFACAQYFSNASNAISFSSTGSLYSDGGMRLTKDLYVSGTSYFNNVTVFGTQSINYITSSQLNIASNLITVNTSTPAVRFGGLAVYDSGSLGTGLTGSILWDSEANHWVYSNPSGSSYSGGMFISGPRSAALGSEQGTTACALMMGQGGDHITSSAVFHYGNSTCFYGQSFISSSGNACFSGQVCSNTVSTTDGTNTSTLANNYLRYNGGDFYVDACAVGGNFRIRTSNASALDNTALFICGGNSNVGIGTTTPAYKLDVNGSFSFTTGGNYLQYSSGILYHGNYYQYPSGNDYLLFARPSGGLNFGTNDIQRLSISSTGIASFTCQICTVAAVTADLRYTGTGYITYDTSVSGTSCLIVRQDAAERIRFNGAGCISVGTTCTLGRLTVASEAGTSGITLLNTTAATLGTETQFITWEGLTNGSALHACPLGRIGVINVNGGTSIGTMVFYTKQYNAGICERMRITSDGNVGIGGLPGDGYRLQVVGTSQAQTTISQTYAGVSAAAMKITSGGDWAVGVDLADGGTNRFRITSTGIACFACQVCAPQLYACVSSAAAITIDGYSKLSFADRGTEYGTINASRYNFGGESTLMTFQSSKCFLFLSGLNCLMFINSANGNVGIGTIPCAWSTGTTLEIGGTGNLALHNSSPIGNLIAFNIYYNSAWYYKQTNVALGYVQDSEGHKFYFNGSGTAGTTFTPCERMRITSTGQLAIGTTSTSTEANLFLGAQGTIEGGQLVLQKGTSCSCATHLDNYQDQFRILSGTNTATTIANVIVDHKTGNTCFFGSVAQLNTTLDSSAKYGQKFIYAGSNFDNPLVALYTAGNGTNAVAVVKVTVYQTAFGSQNSNIHVGYATLMGQNASGTTTSMTIEYNGGIGSVGTLSWSGHQLNYQTNRVSNYDSYTIKVELAGSLGASF